MEHTDYVRAIDEPELFAHNQRVDILMRLERIEQWLAQIASLLQRGVR